MNNNPSENGLTPREAAEEVLKRQPLEPLAVLRYRSEGRLLVLGSSVAIEAIIDRLPALPGIYIAAIDIFSPTLSARLLERGFAGRDALSEISIQGWMGRFRVNATHGTDLLCLEELFGLGGSGFDLILDLCDPCLSPSPAVPIGYFAVGSSNENRLARALTELPLCVGELIKPQYVQFKHQPCDHHHADTVMCRRCLDVCETWAISSVDQQITLNPYLCQGCGDCATVCPTGAFQFAYPPVEYALLRIGAMLSIYHEHGGKTPILLLHDRSRGRDWFLEHRARLPINILPFEVESLGSTGMELWLMALAQGASQVLILDARARNHKTRRIILSQVRAAQAILRSLGYPDGLIRLIGPDDLTATLLPLRPVRTVEPILAAYEGQDKRSLISAAIQHLQFQPLTDASVALPEGGFFGAVRVDADSCTLCMHCVTLCPESALIAVDDGPGLAFIESNCIQCGGCAGGCPEQAIALEPRFLFDRAVATSPALLKRG